MYKFSQISLNRLSQCDPKLQTLFNRVIEIFDCAILEGHRSKELQDRYFEDGRSKEKWPKSKHNSFPSKAVDVVPCIKGKPCYDKLICYYFSGLVRGICELEKIQVMMRWGGDWDSDLDFYDQGFNDLVHYELK